VGLAPSWSYLIMEGESYVSETESDPGVGSSRFTPMGVTNFLANPVLGTDTTASGRGAYSTSPRRAIRYKITYKVMFATPGLTICISIHEFREWWEPTHYISEDSFFFLQTLTRNLQNDWGDALRRPVVLRRMRDQLAGCISRGG